MAFYIPGDIPDKQRRAAASTRVADSDESSATLISEKRTFGIAGRSVAGEEKRGRRYIRASPEF